MAVMAYPADVQVETRVAPARRSRVRESDESDPLFRIEATGALSRVTITHRLITIAQFDTLKAWLDALGDDDTVTIVALDGVTYRGRFTVRQYTVQQEGQSPLRRATIQLLGNPQ